MDGQNQRNKKIKNNKQTRMQSSSKYTEKITQKYIYIHREKKRISENLHYNNTKTDICANIGYIGLDQTYNIN